jgi:hypothetical protein
MWCIEMCTVAVAPIYCATANVVQYHCACHTEPGSSSCHSPVEMVDYTINLESDEDMIDLILELLQNVSYNLRTINQTRDSAVQLRPIAISIETKTPD